MTGFSVSHGSVTNEKALVSALNVESCIGRLLSGDTKALNKVNVEDLVVLIQFARNKSTAKPSQKHCLHMVIESEFGGAECGVCGQDFGWFCPIGLKSICEYTDGDECCIHCGQPEERK
jgi:hypothetical protein